MPTIYYEDKALFGPTWSASLPLNFTESSREVQNKMKKEFKTQKDLMSKGKNRLKKKNHGSKTFIFKGCRVWFRCGSGKPVFEHKYREVNKRLG